MDKKCFIIIPFREELKSFFEEIQLIYNDLNVECRRSREIVVGSIVTLPALLRLAPALLQKLNFRFAVMSISNFFLKK